MAERLDVIPATFRALAIRRPKYGSRFCEAGSCMPPEKGRLTLYGPGFTEAGLDNVQNYLIHMPTDHTA